MALTRADDVVAFKAAVEGRIQSLGRAHSMLADSRWEGADLRRILREELAPYCTDNRERLTQAGPELLLKPAAAQSLALVIHELATNAAKYGALSVPEGKLTVNWSTLDEAGRAARLSLSWTEQGGPLVARPTPSDRVGFGSRLMRGSVEGQLGGSLQLDWATGGLAATIEFPLDRSLQLGGPGEDPPTSPRAANDEQPA